MRARKILAFSGWLSLLLALPLLLSAQGTREDYERAAGLGNKLRRLVLDAVKEIGDSISCPRSGRISLTRCNALIYHRHR